MYKHNMRGPKTFEEWVAVYEERDDSEFVLSHGEEVYWHPMHGFFTYAFDPARREILIPKMCGDGRYLRRIVYQMLCDATLRLGVRGVLCCTKHNPQAFLRVHGGRLVKMEHTYDFRSGEESTLWYIFVTMMDSKERGKQDGMDDSDCSCSGGGPGAVAGDVARRGQQEQLEAGSGSRAEER